MPRKPVVGVVFKDKGNLDFKLVPVEDTPKIKVLKSIILEKKERYKSALRELESAHCDLRMERRRIAYDIVRKQGYEVGHGD